MELNEENSRIIHQIQYNALLKPDRYNYDESF